MGLLLHPLQHANPLNRCVFYGDLYPNRECYNDAIARRLRKLMIVRKNFAYGPLKDYPEHANCIGFMRNGDPTHGGCAVVISNASDEDR